MRRKPGSLPIRVIRAIRGIFDFLNKGAAQALNEDRNNFLLTSFSTFIYLIAVNRHP